MAGFSPGPARVALGAGERKAVVLALAMPIGMGVFELLERRRRAAQPSHERTDGFRSDFVRRVPDVRGTDLMPNANVVGGGTVRFRGIGALPRLLERWPFE
jgi:hypothetical protein